MREQRDGQKGRQIGKRTNRQTEGQNNANEYHQVSSKFT